MDIVTIIEIGAVSLAVGMSAYQSVAHAQARAKLDRARAFYVDNTPSENRIYIDANETVYMRPAENETQLCGGCGLNLTLDQIGACTGETCPLYLNDDILKQQGPTMIFDYAPPEYKPVQRKKINIGFTGHLHTDR